MVNPYDTNEAVDAPMLLKMLHDRPEKDLRNAWRDIREGNRPECAPIRINRQLQASEHPPARGKLSLAERLEWNIRCLMAQLKFENPSAPSLEIGYGAGTMPAVFGAKLDLLSNEYPDMPKENIPLADFDDFELPPIEQTAAMIELREEIEFFKANTPEEFLISLPNLQGPFNVVHTIIGSELLTLIYDEPQRVSRLLGLVTDAMIQALTLIPQWIGLDRLSPTPGMSYCIASTQSRCFISECSCNLISPDMYRKFVLPWDLRLAERFGRLAIHPCSGRHVFEATLEGLPNIRYTEAGWIEHLGDRTISVEEALEKIGKRDIILSVREELVAGCEAERIKEMIDLAREHPQMYLSYTGMYWQPKDDEFIKELHREMDSYYHR